MRIPTLLLTLGLCLGGGAFAGASLYRADDDAVDPMEHLSKYVGTWQTATEFWMTPGADPITWEGTATGRLVGSFLVTEHQAEIEMFGQRMEFSGIDFSGYDTLKEAWVSTWVDNQSQWLTHSEGGFDEAGDLVKRADMFNPMLGQSIPTDMTDHWISEDEWTMTFSQPQENAEPITTMRIVMRRSTEEG